ncbi:glycosyltransferase [Granulicella paludicola]|uniref:glycosyltransferase n=1 Tax=Granulicella paludicola TaxID=474951 RepID=UPI0021E0EB0E|nr:glycosyltransferase [Granulicella paludicola]
MKAGGRDIASDSAAPLPLVSVIIPYYSQGSYIAETIQSVRRQTYPNIELIVIDDGSAEVHAEALRKLEGLVVHRIPNSGPPAARNFGFHQSSGEYLVFLDADDVLTDESIQKNLHMLLANPKAALAFGAVEVIDSHGQTLIKNRVCLPRRNYFLMLLETNPIWSPGAAMVRRTAFKQAEGFRDMRQFQADDYEFYLHLARIGDFCQHDECVLRYRRHSSNMSNDRERLLWATLEGLDRLAAEHQLGLLERLQLWHGRRRWQHEFSDRKGLLAELKSFYFKIATFWNIDALYLLQKLTSRD